MPQTPSLEPIWCAAIVSSTKAAASATLVSSSHTTIFSSDVSHFSRAAYETAKAEATNRNTSEGSAAVGPAASATTEVLTKTNHLNLINHYQFQVIKADHLQYLFKDEIHFWPSYYLFSVIQFRREILPVGGLREHVNPVVIRSRSCLSTKMSSKYQFMGQVSHSAKFLFTPVTTLHLTLNTFAQCSTISLNVSLSGPTASTYKLFSLSIPFTINEAMSSACTYWKQQLPSPGKGKNGNLFTKQAVLFINIPSYTDRPNIAHGFTIPQPNPDSFKCCYTLAFSLIQGNGESSDVWVCDVKITFFTPAYFAQSISNLEFYVTLSLLKPRVLSNLTQQV